MAKLTDNLGCRYMHKLSIFLLFCVCVWGGGGNWSMVKMFNSIFVSSFIIKLFKLDGRLTSL